jgi:hypothetical protein
VLPKQPESAVETAVPLSWEPNSCALFAADEAVSTVRSLSSCALGSMTGFMLGALGSESWRVGVVPSDGSRGIARVR